MRTFVYIDGFNVYYRAVRGTPYKWLNVRALVDGLLDEDNEILEVKYYTARVSGHIDFDQPRRQHIYLSALATIEGLSIHYGNFLQKTIRRPLVGSPKDNPQFVVVHDTEEKGSDVNLATHLVHDAWRDVYDVAVILSQDTDLIEPMRIVSQELNKQVGLIWLDGKEPKAKLKQYATFVRHVTRSRLKAAQFPDPVVKPDGGTVRKPRRRSTGKPRRTRRRTNI